MEVIGQLLDKIEQNCADSRSRYGVEVTEIDCWMILVGNLNFFEPSIGAAPSCFECCF